MSGRVKALTAALIVAALLSPAAAMAAGSGSFSATGSLAVGRELPGAARLPDGRVLVAGGAGIGYFTSAEIFDPSTGTFSPTGSLGTPRYAPATAPLPDGRVLVAGGRSGGASYEASAEVFNPATGTFSPTGSMIVPRSGAAAAPLPDGRVLVAGGYDGSGGGVNYLESAEIFNPATGTFSPTGSLSTKRYVAVGAPLPAGRALVAGGIFSTTVFDTAEVFDPQTGAFSSVGLGTMTTPRERAAAAPLPDGRVLIAGGFRGSLPLLSSAEVFNPQTNNFSSAGIGSMQQARLGPAAAPLADGRVLVVGGDETDGRSAEIYAATNTFSFAPQGKKLIVNVEASGTVSVAAPAATLSAMAAGKKGKKRKKRPALLTSGGSGDPPTIVVALRLNKVAKAKLKRRGKVTVPAKITFTPQGGLANTQTASLRIVQKKKKKRK